MQCSQCGNLEKIFCNSCGKQLTVKQHLISDFIIGGHAMEKADKLLTRDRGFYRNYFKELKVECLE